MEKYEDVIGKLLLNQRLGVLATDMDGLPYTTLVAFAAINNLHSIVFATLKDTRKFSNIKKNPNVTLLIDNRANKPTDFQNAIAVTAEGKIISNEAHKSQMKHKFLEKHPYLEEFVNSPNCALLRLQVEKYHYVSHFQNVKILVLKE